MFHTECWKKQFNFVRKACFKFWHLLELTVLWILNFCLGFWIWWWWGLFLRGSAFGMDWMLDENNLNWIWFMNMFIFWLSLIYLTMTCGAAARTASVAMMVNSVNVIKQSRSRTIAANFQSLSIALASSSSRILSVITLISFNIKLSSRGTPLGYVVLTGSSLCGTEPDTLRIKIYSQF